MMNYRHTILVVDDDAFIRRPLEFILRQEGFDPLTADGGPACMEQLAANRPDLIIMDVMMPGTDGFELCKTIKREIRYANIPIILLSARNRDLDKERGLSLGAADFLAKPYSPSELLGRVREILSEKEIDGGSTR
jgi:two-component system alkaline phosphatase synthesis response regulator PhoP